jgi:hypothetical protein
MAINLLTGRRTGKDWSCSISGDDADVGSFLNPFSWFSSSNKESTQDERELEEARKKAKEAEKKAKEAAVQVKLDKDAEALERKAEAAKDKAKKHKSESSGIGLSFDAMGRATIVDLPHHRRR